VSRQPLVIVEAMKMENELRAPRAGIVAAVHASEGQSVEAHAVLVILE
jgi:pyruvate carboxylase subunit B